MGGKQHSKKDRDAAPAGNVPAPELGRQIAALAEQVRRLGERAQAPDAHGVAVAPPTPAPSPAVDLAGMIATAERIAEEIRASARREAARVEADRLHEGKAASSGLLAMVKRQRQTLAVLAAETRRIEQSAEILRTQVGALDAELQRMYDALGAAPRPPVDVRSR